MNVNDIERLKSTISALWTQLEHRQGKEAGSFDLRFLADEVAWAASLESEPAPTTHEAAEARWKRKCIASDRSSYLCAVAMHHASVAQIACEMLKLCRPHTWHTETLEYMAEKINQSHIKNFGTPLDPKSQI